jgi:hypothetical protein
MRYSRNEQDLVSHRLSYGCPDEPEEDRSKWKSSVQHKHRLMSAANVQLGDQNRNSDENAGFSMFMNVHNST